MNSASTCEASEVRSTATQGESGGTHKRARRLHLGGIICPACLTERRIPDRVCLERRTENIERQCAAMAAATTCAHLQHRIASRSEVALLGWGEAIPSLALIAWDVHSSMNYDRREGE